MTLALGARAGLQASPVTKVKRGISVYPDPRGSKVKSETRGPKDWTGRRGNKAWRERKATREKQGNCDQRQHAAIHWVHLHKYSVHLGIEFYLFVSHEGKVAKRFSKFTRGSSVASYLHEKQTSRIQSLYLYFNYFIKIVPFWLRNIRFLIQNTRSLLYGCHYSSLHRLMSLHRKLNVKIFLCLS